MKLEFIKTVKGWYYISTFRKYGKYALWVGPFKTEESAHADAKAVGEPV